MIVHPNRAELSRRVPRTAFLVLLAAAPAIPAFGDDDASRARLAAIPLEQRTRLAEKLTEFDKLDRSTQDGIRSIDQKLAALPATERAGYQAVLRRYHLWLESLPETQRNEIRSLPPERRMAAINKLLADPGPLPRSSSQMVLRIAEFGDLSPYDLADQVRVWQVLKPEQRSEVSRLVEPARDRRIKGLAREYGIAPTRRPNRPNDEAFIERALKNGYPPLWNLRKKDDASNKGDLLKAARIKTRMLEQLAFLESPPARVSPENLARFAGSLPSWIRALYDPLPPDEARRRLTVLYRLVFPAPAEFGDPKPVTTTKSAAVPAAPTPNAPGAPGTKAGTGSGTGTSPF